MNKVTYDEFEKLVIKTSKTNLESLNFNVLANMRMTRQFENHKWDFEVYLKKYEMNLQRDHTWNDEQEQQFLKSVAKGISIPSVILIQHEEENGQRVYKVVDGQHRLKCLRKFLNNEIPIHTKNGDIYYDNLDYTAQTLFDNPSFRRIEYYSYYDMPITDDQMLELFCNANFMEVEQSLEHKTNVISIYKKI